MAQLLAQISQTFDNFQSELTVVDLEPWRMTVKTADDRRIQFRGYFDPDGLSEAMRQILQRPHLYLFDGDPDRIDALQITYHPAASQQEDLRLSRADQQFFWQQTTDTTAAQLTLTTATVALLLDQLGEITWQSATPANVELHLTLQYRYAQTPTHLSGSLSTLAEITGWPEAAATISAWLAKHSPQVLDARIFSRRPYAPGMLCYCQVVFHHGGKPYSYLSQSHDLAIGARVVVPLGPNDTLTYGTVIACDYYWPQEAPYPPAKTKSIIGIADSLKEALGGK